MDIVSGATPPPIVAAGRKPERQFKSIEIEGCTVEFPFEPYDCQRDYMGRVIRALKEGKNALLESPTGTGKTLCLLCATLAWRESLRGGGAGSLPDPVTGALFGSAPGPGMLPGSSTGPLALAGTGNGGGRAPGFPGQPPNNSWGAQGASRAPVDPALAHLHPVLQTVLAANGPMGGPSAAGGGVGGEGLGMGGKGGNSDLPLIIYSSRTHSQLTQVIKELKNSSYRDRVRSTVLSSRGQTCQHPVVSKMSGGAANQACKAVTSQKKCSWYNNLKYGKRKNDWVTLLDNVPDIEDMVTVGRNHNLCPFFMGKDGSKEADVIFMPYNYLLDSTTRKALAEQVRWENAVVIFDEAHNVEGVCSDSSSWDITARQLTDAMGEAQRVWGVCSAQLQRGAAFDETQPPSEKNMDYKKLQEDLTILQRLLKMVETELHSMSSKMPKEGGLTRPGIYLFEFLAKFNITKDSVSLINNTVDRATEALLQSQLDAGQTVSSNRAGTAMLQHIQSCLNLAFSTLDPISAAKDAPPAHKGYRVHIHMEKSWGADKLAAPTLSYWCFIPGMAFRMLKNFKLRSILLTSGTLSPLDSFAHELQLPFEVRLENPHIIQPSQVWVGVLPTGPSGYSLCSDYKSRDDDKYKEDLGNAVVNFARQVPDGLLVFFPSYTVMNACLEHWRRPGAGAGASIWERISRLKAPVVEPRDSGVFQQAIEEFKSRLDDPATSGAVFFAVCRGKVSEGLDFSDRAGRGVIITGIPYAMKTDPKVRLKQEVLNEAKATTRGPGLSGEMWYSQTAMRAVNQAMGRVIRHRWDYGAVILADRRFGDPSVQRQLSRWLQDHVVIHPNFGAAASSLSRFFAEKVGFKAPAGASKATAGNAFQTVAALPGPSDIAGRQGGGGYNSYLNSGPSLMDLAPAAVDVSGLNAMAGAFGRGNPSRPNTTEAGAGSRVNGAPPAHTSQEQGPSQGQKQQQQAGLLGVLQAQQKEAAEGGAGGGGQQPVSGALIQGAGIGGGQSTAAPPAPAPPKAAWLAPAPLPYLQAHNRAQQAAVPQQRAQICISYDEPKTGQGASRSNSMSALGSGGSGQGAGSQGGLAPGREHKGSVVLAPPGKLQQRQQRMSQEPSQGAEEGTGSQAVGAADWDPQQHGPGGGSAPPSRASSVERQRQAEQGPKADTAAAAAAATDSKATGPTASAGTGSSKTGAPSGGSKSQQAQDVMATLRSELPKHIYEALTKLLTAYRTSKDSRSLLEQMVALLKGPSTVKHLASLVSFIPSSDRPWFSEVVKTHTDRAAALSQATKPQSETLLKGKPSVDQAKQVGAAAAAAAVNPRGASRPGTSVPGLAPGLMSGRPPGAAGAVGRGSASEAGQGGVRQGGVLGGGRPGAQQQLPGAGGSRPLQQQQLHQQTLPVKRPASAGGVGAGSAGGQRQGPQGGPSSSVAAPQPGAQGTRGVTASASLEAAAKKPRTDSTSEPCVMCKKSRSQDPYRAPCSHVGCYQCWIPQLAQHMACPVCKHALRRNQLTKLYFA